MPEMLGFLSLTEGIKFGDDNLTWVHAMNLGSFVHPRWGTIEFTPEKVTEFADNVNNNVRGIELDIDYDHKESSEGNKAAGWVKKAEARSDGLWLSVEWTDPAKEALKNKEYKYFSPEFMDEWTDADGTTHSNVLFGGGITNRPFLKGLNPVNLSEMFNMPINKFSQEQASYRPGDSSMRRCLNCAFYREGSCLVVDGDIDPDYYSDYFMPVYNETGEIYYDESGKRRGTPTHREEVELDPKKLAEILGLPDPEKATEETVDAALKALKEKGDKAEADAAKLKAFEDAEVKRLEEEAKTAKFAEEYPEEAKRLADQDARLTELTNSNKLAETTTKLREWETGEAGGLPTSLNETITDVRTGLTEEQAIKFDEIMETITKDGLVSGEEKGSSKGGDTEKSPTEEMEKRIEKAMSEDKDLSYKDAMTKVASEDKDLANAHLNEG